MWVEGQLLSAVHLRGNKAYCCFLKGVSQCFQWPEVGLFLEGCSQCFQWPEVGLFLEGCSQCFQWPEVGLFLEGCFPVLSVA